MASNKAVAAAFAAGLAAGGGVGVQIDEDKPAFSEYVVAASELAITDVLDDRLPKVRANQLKDLSEDIRADVESGETVKVRELTQRLAEKVRTDDPLWLVWYAQNFAIYLQDQITAGQAAGNLTLDDEVLLADVVDAMGKTAQLHIPMMPLEAGMSAVSAQQSLAEDARLKGERLRERGLIE